MHGQNHFKRVSSFNFSLGLQIVLLRTQTGCAAHPVSYSIGSERFTSGVKLPMYEANHSSPYSPKVKIKGNCTFTAYIGPALSFILYSDARFLVKKDEMAGPLECIMDKKIHFTTTWENQVWMILKLNFDEECVRK